MSEFTEGAKQPKLFISYSWTSSEHEAWVLKLAQDLAAWDVDVILDKWSLRHGNDTHAFMEQASDPSVDKVAMICDRLYVEKANKREGGAGIEAQIITPGVYESHDQSKYVAVVVERDANGKPYVPTYYGARKYIDFTDPSNHGVAFEELARWIYDKPVHVKPPRGKRPVFLDEEERSIVLSTGPLQRAAVAAIKAMRPNAVAALREYFEAFTEQLEEFRVQLKQDDTDEVFMASIEAFVPYRNEMVDVLVAVASNMDTDETREAVHGLFESLIRYHYQPPHGVGSWREIDFDNYKFITHELFLYAVAAYLRAKSFEGVAYLLDREYFIGNISARNRDMTSFCTFRHYVKTFEWRKQRLGSNRISLQADTLRDRCKGTAIDFQQVMTADFVLYLRAAFQFKGDFGWYPLTIMFLLSTLGSYERPLELFARAKSAEFFERIKPMFGLTDAEAFRKEIARIEASERVPTFDYERVSLSALTNAAALATTR